MRINTWKGQINVYHNRNGNALIPAIIIASIIVSAGLYFFVTRKQIPTAQDTTQQQSEFTDPQKTFSDLSSESLASIPDNWKTSTQRGYIIQYPPDLTPRDSRTYDSITEDGWISIGSTYRIFIASYPTGKAEIAFRNASTTSVENVIVAGQKTKKTIGIETTAKKGTLIHIGPISMNGTEYKIVYNSGTRPAQPSSIQIFNMMVSTFKFSN